MNTIFDTSTREQLIARINLLTDESKAEWGKMNVFQMVKHCRLWEEMMLGRTQYKRVLIGRIFGKLALKSVMKEGPLTRNSPTIPEMRISESGLIEDERNKWVALIREHAKPSGIVIQHPFFGKMTREQVGIMAYKHTDHHLRQFGV